MSVISINYNRLICRLICIIVRITGEIIGTCSVSNVSPDTSMVGFYTVDARLHGQGIGRKIWDETMSSVDRNTTNLFLNGVPKMWAKYKDVEGFDKLEEAKLFVYDIPRENFDAGKLKDLDSLGETTLEIIEGGSSEQLLEQVFTYDESIVGFSRRECWSIYLRGKNSPLTLAIFKGEQIVGFGCGRRDIDDNLIVGPLYADSIDLFEVILRNIVERIELKPEQRVRVQCLSTNTIEIELLADLGFEKVLWGVRQFTKFIHKPAAASKIYCIQSPGFFLY